MTKGMVDYVKYEVWSTRYEVSLCFFYHIRHWRAFKVWREKYEIPKFNNLPQLIDIACRTFDINAKKQICFDAVQICFDAVQICFLCERRGFWCVQICFLCKRRGFWCVQICFLCERRAFWAVQICFRAVQICFDAVQICFDAVQICFGAVQICFGAVQICFCSKQACFSKNKRRNFIYLMECYLVAPIYLNMGV